MHYKEQALQIHLLNNSFFEGNTMRYINEKSGAEVSDSDDLRKNQRVYPVLGQKAERLAMKTIKKDRIERGKEGVRVPRSRCAFCISFVSTIQEWHVSLL